MRVLPTATVLLLAIGAPAVARAASFDCAKATTPDEHAICSDRALNDQDVRMEVYLSVLGQLQLMGANGAMRDEQREWLAKRHACGADRVCLTRAYKGRVGQLAAAYAAFAQTVR